MKYILTIAVISLLASCSTTPHTEESCDLLQECKDECVFSYTDREAMTYYLGCFDRWGYVYRSDDDYLTGLIPDDMDSKYKTDSVHVMICGYARVNEIPLQFPDPAFNNVYQSEVIYVEEMD